MSLVTNFLLNNFVCVSRLTSIIYLLSYILVLLVASKLLPVIEKIQMPIPDGGNFQIYNVVKLKTVF